MKPSLFVLFNLIFTISCIAQVQINSDGSLIGQMFIDKQGLEYYKHGITFFENGKFVEADSLFSLALCTYKNEDVYFNRAITKLVLLDTIGFCSDLKISAHSFFDKNAAILFNNTCCNHIDTNYYDKKGLPIEKNKYRYLEEVLSLKYEKDTIGFIHHKNKKRNMIILDYDCGFASNSMSFRNTDILGMYYIRSNEKFYKMTTTPPRIKVNFNYDDLLRRNKIAFQNKFAKLKTSENDEITLTAEFTINKVGQISEIKLVQVIPPCSDEKVKSELENDISSMIRRFPNFKPATIFNIDVNYVYYYQLKF